MKKILIALIVLPLMVFGQTKESKTWYRGFTGGMQVHTGFIQGDPFNVITKEGRMYSQQVKGPAFGIGGKISFYLGDYIRIGGEGYATKTSYGDYKSLQQLNWGGFLIEGVLPLKDFSFIGGTCFGGGKVTNTVLIEDPGLNFITTSALIRRYPLILINPFLGVEYAITPKMQLIFKVDYMMNINKIEPDFAAGARVYLGFMFQHKK